MIRRNLTFHLSILFHFSLHLLSVRGHDIGHRESCRKTIKIRFLFIFFIDPELYIRRFNYARDSGWLFKIMRTFLVY